MINCLNIISNNFLAGIHFAENDQYGLAFLDISTGEFFIAEGDREYADKLLQSFKPAEVFFNDTSKKILKNILEAKFILTHLDEWIFDPKHMLKKFC